jgi:tRNA(Ile)-lysidine synthase
MPAPRGLVQWLDQQLHRTQLLPRGARLLVGVSGGADSVALVRLLAAINESDYWKWELVVGHVDHGIRGKASAGDGLFVRGLARQLGLPWMGRKLGLKAGSSEEAARAGRLGALAEMVEARGCQGVVLAHHADDQAETVLMKLFRGCGLGGLSGMSGSAEVEGLTILRPLLEVRRSALREYLGKVGQAWREDASNASAEYTRNRLRREVLPAIETVWPRALEAVVRMSRIAREAREPIEDAAKEIWEMEAQVTRGRVVFAKRALFTWDALVAEVLRRAVEHVGGTREIADWERIAEGVRLIGGEEGGKSVEMGRGVVLRVGGGRVVVERENGVVKRGGGRAGVRRR